MFGKKIKELRQTSGLNQTELAKKLDSTQSKISKYEREELDLSTDLIVKICKTFNVSADYLLGLSDDQQPKLG